MYLLHFNKVPNSLKKVFSLGKNLAFPETQKANILPNRMNATKYLWNITFPIQAHTFHVSVMQDWHLELIKTAHVAD